MKYVVALAIGVLAASASQAQMSPDMKMSPASPPTSGASGVMTNGVVQQVDAKTGDKVKFHVEMVKGAPTVTRIEPAR